VTLVTRTPEANYDYAIRESLTLPTGVHDLRRSERFSV
jgi:hypothetical protein